MKPKSKAKQKTKPQPKNVVKVFDATLERLRSNLGWIVIWIPFDVQKVWDIRGRLRVKGSINGFPFRTSLFPTRKGEHFLLVNKNMQAGGNTFEGTTAEFLLELDTDERIVVVPTELKSILSEDKSFRLWFDELSYSIRKWICDLAKQPKSAAARVRRAEKIAEQLYSAMEAERDLPPAIVAALTQDPRAIEGWELMSPLHRRSQLLAIFHYRSPEARARRLQKVVEEAIALAEKKFS
jgi:hypothetical protein